MAGPESRVEHLSSSEIYTPYFDVLIIDNDGVYSERPLPLQAAMFRVVFQHVIGGQHTISPLEAIPEKIDWDQVDTNPLPLSQKLSLWQHRKRRENPYFGEFLARLPSSIPVFMATGRRSQTDWIRMNKRALEKNQPLVNRIERVFYRPEGLSSAEGKAAAIREVEGMYPGKRIMLVDDDPQTIVKLARKFPDVMFALLADASAGVLLKGTELPVNVRIVGSFAEIIGQKVDGAETRNNPLRQLVEKTVSDLVDKAVAIAPDWVTANKITFIGALVLTVGGYLAYKAQTSIHLTRDQLIALATEATSVFSDTFDGAWARAVQRRNTHLGKAEIPNYWGGVLDSSTDRFLNGIMAFFRTLEARDRGSKAGVLAALFVMMTAPLPAFARKIAERYHQLAVKEGGPGTHPMRMAEAILMTTFPTLKGVELQPVVDALMGVLALNETWNRLHVHQNETQTRVSERTYRQAQLMLPIMIAFTAVSAVMAPLLYHRWYGKKP